MFLRRFAGQFSRQGTGLTPAAAAALQRHLWPGNLCELESQMQRAVLLCEREQIDVCDLALALPVDPDFQTHSPLERARKEIILATLKECAGNKSATARKLGISRPTLYSELAGYGLETAEAQTSPAEPFGDGV